MEAPDKIYVREYQQGLNQLWSSVLATETSAIAQHEYIRKDALLEDLEEMATNTGSHFQRAIIELVIHKIKSL